MQHAAPSKPIFGLRVIAIYKFCKTLLMLGAAWGLFQLAHYDLNNVWERVLVLFHLKTEYRLVEELRAHFITLTPHMLKWGGVDALICAALYLVEGLGLWWHKRWAEWVVIINSCILVPFEIKSLWLHRDWLHVAILLINLVIIAYVARVVWVNRRQFSVD